MKNFLVVEDNADIANLVAMHLRDLDGHVDLANNGKQGLSLAQSKRYDLIVLDLMLPGLDGLEICKRLRGQAGAPSDMTPILMLTAKSAELDRIVGLEMGADDYLTKPFSILELMARVKAILRRVKNSEPGTVSSGEHIDAGDLQLDKGRRQATIKGQPVELTAREFDLLWHFARHPGQVFTRTRLLDTVWGYGHDGYEHTVNSHINRLRAKIEQQPSRPEYILTVWGVGYKFNDSLVGK
ncbi:MAG: response regulator transcription factor [Gammaproteobacteria bacterium]|nr:response regulator transcription factor [Gammaproteobacteria bacterium]